MGQPDTVNQLPASARLLNSEFEKLLEEPYDFLPLEHTAYNYG